jgi:hypothetical protein
MHITGSTLFEQWQSQLTGNAKLKIIPSTFQYTAKPHIYIAVVDFACASGRS